MKKMTKMIVGVFCALLLVTAAYAAPTNTVTAAKAPVAVQTVKAPAATSLFNAGEVGLQLGTAYTVDRAAAFKQPYGLNANAGLFWFPLRNVGFEAGVPFYSTKGISCSEVTAGTVLRFPLSKTATVWKNLAPYVGLGGVYSWETPEKWGYIGKVGVEARINKGWGVFAEGQYRLENFNWSEGQTSVVGGLRLVF